MKILINLSGNYVGGALNVSMSFLDECKSKKNIYFIVVIGNVFKELLKINDFPNNFSFVYINFSKWYLMPLILPKIEKRYSPDVVFSVFGPPYCKFKVPQLVGFAQGYYIYHESIFWNKMSSFSFFKERIKEKIHIYFYKKNADAIVTETSDASKRISELIGSGKKYFTVSNTFNSCFLKQQCYSIKSKLESKNSSEIRLLTVSRYYLHKNIEIIPHVIDNLLNRGVTDIRFILTIDEAIFKKIFSLKYQKYVYNVGSVRPEELPALYSQCDFVFLPTLIECFSASYVEAMITKKPILTSDLGFAHSICGDAALYFNPESPSDIASSIVTLCNDSKMRENLILKGYNRSKHFPSAQERASAYLKICAELSKV